MDKRLFFCSFVLHPFDFIKLYNVSIAPMHLEWLFQEVFLHAPMPKPLLIFRVKKQPVLPT